MRRCIYDLPGRAGGGFAGQGWRGRSQEGGALHRPGSGRASPGGLRERIGARPCAAALLRSLRGSPAAPGVWALARR